MYRDKGLKLGKRSKFNTDVVNKQHSYNTCCDSGYDTERNLTICRRLHEWKAKICELICPLLQTSFKAYVCVYI